MVTFMIYFTWLVHGLIVINKVAAMSEDFLVAKLSTVQVHNDITNNM